MPQHLDALLGEFGAGSKRAAARLISIVEDQHPDARAVLAHLYPRVGQAKRVGITGPPGAGKSTLVDRLVQRWVARGEQVGIVAVDPTSPFTGGALLGDRIRMGPVANDPQVFFRSLASRGSLGGLSLHTAEVVDILDAFGCGSVLLETVGVGQSELDVASKAHTTVVVLVPESGDGVQVMKAGLMEIADVFVVNKADRSGAGTLASEIQGMLDLGHWPDWRPPVVQAKAREGDGIEALDEALSAHRAYLETSGRLAAKKREAVESRVHDLVLDGLERGVWADPESQAHLARGLEAIARGESTPYHVAGTILESIRPRARASTPNAEG